jgi:hypothetical protein
MEEWIRDFIAEHTEEGKPDGRPLYQYRVNGQEFSSLESILNDAWDPGSSRSSGNALFVLFASECWRREYNGGHWSWELITSRLLHGDYDYQNLSSAVEDGFNYWKREVHRFPGTSHRDFLGTVVSESGIPDYALREGNRLRILILGSFKRFGEIAFSEDRLSMVASIVPDNFPQVLKQVPFYRLIETIVDDLRELKVGYDLGRQNNPVLYLDNHVPGWRERFPVQVDSETGAQFLEEI